MVQVVVLLVAQLLQLGTLQMKQVPLLIGVGLNGDWQEAQVLLELQVAQGDRQREHEPLLRRYPVAHWPQTLLVEHMRQLGTLQLMQLEVALVTVRIRPGVQTVQFWLDWQLWHPVMLTQETQARPSELGDIPVEQAEHWPWVLQVLQLLMGHELTQLFPLSR